ncbi:MAG: 6,7-dimethyl-8-ribityllumazine synthase [Bacteroidetes bacterium]|nr:6,7-dimethyl-8-ribityllumazine synthase [Bacteroidota bacterium]
MASSLKYLSSFDKTKYINCADFNVGIVVSEWNRKITENLLEGALEVFCSVGISKTQIFIEWVPGSFELPLGAQLLSRNQKIDGIVAIGVVIQGETKHFDFVCQGTTNGIMQVMLSENIPISFCVLTDNTIQQSIERSGGKYGNKGIEAAASCLDMIRMTKKFNR